MLKVYKVDITCARNLLRFSNKYLQLCVNNENLLENLRKLVAEEQF